MAADFKKDPGAVLEYGFDWSDWLEDGDKLVSSSWTIHPQGKPDDLQEHARGTKTTDTTTLIWLEKGREYVTYDITNRIETQAGRTDERTFSIAVMNR